MPDRPDWVLGVGFALLGAVLGAAVLYQSRMLYFYQAFMPEMVYSACGHGFVRSPVTPPPMVDFLFGRSPVFDCATIGIAPEEPAGIFFRTQLYLGWAVSALWRVTSISYSNLWPLVSALVGAYACGCFVLVRLFFARWPAAAGAALLALSPVMLSMVPYFRDFSKAPFFIWAIVFLILTIRAELPRMALLWAALSGVAVGLGVGFRSDVFILLPIGIIALMVASGLKRWMVGIATMAVFVATALLSAAPLLGGGSAGASGVLLMQGLSDPFQSYLDLGPVPYSLGARYSDEIVLSSVAADLRPADPGWDAGEGKLGHSVSQAITRSGSYLLSWLPYFAGDVTTQALKSAAWVVVFPELVAPGRVNLDPGVPVRAAPQIARLLNRLYDRLANSWVAIVCAAGFIAFFWREAAVRPREAFALFLMFGALLTYPVVQFSVRHVFHLEFIWILAALSFFSVPFEWSRLRGVLPRFLIVAAIAFVGLISMYAGMAMYQDRVLRHQVEALLAEPREPIALVSKSSTSEAAIFSLPLPDRYRALVESAPDSMTPKLGEQSLQWDVRAAGDRILLTFGGESCSEGTAAVSFRYATREGIWQRLDHSISVDLPQDRASFSTVLVPAFYRPTQYLSDIQLPAKYSTCLVKAERMIGQTKLPILLDAVLAPGWQNRPLHRAFGGFSTFGTK
ncbi:hypothetical protein [Bradyrhizobium cajani]|uniref:Uncharacterized protein n=1 Tax=Bradyrhizobium cajani TaxID=1928661 RepID=A0A844T561_9BRAD|nr:hypothetical protein [Bradyrhizobium cajani]MCP3370973.1 hypothetical protein [Bradyrhizobium cajani]MVT71559.1 hypothetical protein [Bradyrhizobium cajani]